MSQSTRSPITRFTALAIASCFGSLLLPHQATAYAPSLVNPEVSDHTLYIAGLSFRLRGLRSSRWRIGGIARSCATETEDVDFETLRQTLAAVAPPLQEEERTETTEEGDLPVDYTVSAHPTVFVHVPPLPGATAELTLQNRDDDEQLYSTKFELTGEEGIIGIKIAEPSPSLTVGQDYLWQMLITGDCNTEGKEFRLHTDGWIERVASTGSLANIDQIPLRDRPTLYAEAGIWQDTLSSLGSLMLQYPDDPEVRASWASLMESANLSEFAQAPLLYIHTDE